MKALLIAEKPSLRRTIEGVYKKHKDSIPYDISFVELRGHLLELKKPSEIDDSLKEWSWDTLPFHPEEYGGWAYAVKSEKKQGNFLTAKERFESIRKELNSGNYDFVINAGDPDQEGQLLVWEVLKNLHVSIPVKRFWSNDVTESKVLEALKNLRDDENDPMLVNLLNAAYARQHSDYRFGINISRAAGIKLKLLNISCGRVKTPIMSMVCKREKDIQNFVPETVYGVQANYEDGFAGILFEQQNEDTDNEEDSGQAEGTIWFNSREEAEDFVSNNLYDTATVIKYEKKRQKTYAPKLFKLASLQVAAGKMGYTAADVLQILQGLYERGYLSYPRTDCEYISSNEDLNTLFQSAMKVPELAKYSDQINDSAISEILNSKRWVNDKKLKESGHSALIPTSLKPDWDSFTQDEKKIYEMVARQFVAIFLPPLIQDKTILITDIDSYTFKSTGKTLVDPGYTVIFGTNFNDVEIPEYKENTRIQVDDYEITEKTSVCPKRFTDADLIAACEAPHKFLEDKDLKKLGKRLKIGTPATRAQIIEEIIKRRYVERKKENKTMYIVPTDIGMYIYDNLKDCAICKVDMTGIWEEKLEMIRQGNMSLDDMEHQMRSEVEDMIDEIKDMDVNVMYLGDDRKTVGDCPECGGKIISGDKSFYCTNYKEKGCKFGLFKTYMGAKISDKDFATLMDHKSIKKSITSKSGKTWDQELTYDFNEHKLEFVKKEHSTYDAKETDYICPKCGSSLIDKGKLISCNCGFTLWKTIAGKQLTEEQLDNFFSVGDTGMIEGFKKKSGEEFSAHIVLNDDRTGYSFHK